MIALPCLVYAMDLTVLNLAVPALSRAGLADVPAQAQSTLGGALEAAHRMPPDAARALVGAAQAAFTDALQLTALTGGVLVLLASALAARMLRRS